MIRLHVADPLAEAAVVRPAEAQARYLLTVMRRAPGDEILVFNGRDGEWRARIDAAGKKGCTLTVLAQTRPQAVGPDLDLIIALVKRAPLELIVEKATELGVRRILPVTTRRTNAGHTNVKRLNAIAVEAAEQTGRLDPPRVCEPQPLDRLLQTWGAERRLMFCDEGGDDASDPFWGGPRGRARPVLDALRDQPRGEPWAVLIGPEGGFAPEEQASLRTTPFAVPVSLGPRILRADTAAIAALTLWQAALGDWEGLTPP
ncbi:16S rRNA (uracil(1498)-N(3))-methyltransferase [soil metagenome]